MKHFDFTNLIALSALLGALQPPFVALLKQDRLSKRVNSVIAFAFSVVVAIVTCAIKGDLTLHDTFGSLLVILTTASATYAGFWKPTGLEPAIQSATSLPPHTDPGVDWKEAGEPDNLTASPNQRSKASGTKARQSKLKAPRGGS